MRCTAGLLPVRAVSSSLPPNGVPWRNHLGWHDRRSASFILASPVVPRFYCKLEVRAERVTSNFLVFQTKVPYSTASAIFYILLLVHRAVLVRACDRSTMYSQIRILSRVALISKVTRGTRRGCTRDCKRLGIGREQELVAEQLDLIQSFQLPSQIFGGQVRAHNQTEALLGKGSETNRGGRYSTDDLYTNTYRRVVRFTVQVQLTCQLA